ncbi:MAG: hypothetical protein ACRELS_13770 [Candidatus Rokuibacteriota bacterium]
MDCETVRARYVDAFLEGAPRPTEIDVHLDGCAACRDHVAGLAAAWAALGALSFVEPSWAVGRRLARRIWWEEARGALAAPGGWRRAAPAGGLAFVVSVILAVLLPYDAIAALCRDVLTAALPTPTAYAVAGLIYGLVPMLVVAPVRARWSAPPGMVGALQAAVVFLSVLVPYAVVQCGGFGLVLIAGFTAGIAIGAGLGAAAGTWLVERHA